MAGSFLRWLIPGAVAIVGGTALALAATDGPLATALQTQATSALATDFDWASVSIDGRDAVVSGTATSKSMVDDAVARLAAIPGVAAVQSRIVLAEYASPYPFSARISDGALALAGGYPSEPIHQALLSRAGVADDSTRPLSGAPEVALFAAGAEFGIDTAKLLDEGDVQLADLSLTISGRAKSGAAYQTLLDLGDRLPAGIRLAAVTITPPLASPYHWTARYDGTRVAITGDTPDPGLADRLRALVPASIAVEASLAVSSGAPQGFTDNTLALLASLITLERGEADITDGTITLAGAPATALVSDAVIASIARLGGTASLEPPRVANFALSAAKEPGILRFTGFVPDKATRDRLITLPGADVEKLALARGAPEHFGEGLDFGLAVLGHLTTGQFDIKGGRLNIGGTAPTVADFKAVVAMLAQGVAGFTVNAGALTPPAADPFLWAATKAGDGSISLTGFVPDEAARTAIHGHIAQLGTDAADPATGAPDGFVLSATKGLAILALVDTGTLRFDGTTWSIEGTVDSLKKGFAVDAAYSVSGLRTAGWTYTLHQPTLPIVAPYVWRAQKSAGGDVLLTGFSPDDAFQDSVKAHAVGASDSTTLGAGAPDGFAASALAGLDALMALDEGAVALDGSRWSLTGTAKNGAARDTVQSKLAAATDVSSWQISITTADAAPAVSPYLWTATKSADGSVDLAGYVPDDTLKADAAARAGAGARDTTTLASGAPQGFADNVAAGLDALTHLSSGKAVFDGSNWSLTGTVATQAEGDAAVAAIQKASAGIPWNVTLDGYAPNSASSAPAESSAAAAPDLTSIAPLLPSSAEPASSAPPDTAAIASAAPAPASAEPASSPEAASSAALSSSEPPPSSEPPSSEQPPSSEPPSSSLPQAPSSQAPAVSEAASSAAPPAQAIEVGPPMPGSLTFEATLSGGKVSLKGAVPTADDAAALGTAAGNAPTDALVPGGNLPDGFAASAAAGLAALQKLDSGHLGFDGAQWWLRGTAETAAVRDAVTQSIAALPGGAGWSVAIDTLPPLDACRSRVASLAKRNAILFTGGKAVLTKDSQPVLDELAADLKICPDTDVHVQGHTDSDGNADVNLALSVSRAEAVVNALVQRGIGEDRLYAEGYGETDPIASNDTKAGKAANRRIAFEIDPR